MFVLIKSKNYLVYAYISQNLSQTIYQNFSYNFTFINHSKAINKVRLQ